MTVPSLLLGDFHLVVGRRIRQINRSSFKAFWPTVLTNATPMFLLLEASPTANCFNPLHEHFKLDVRYIPHATQLCLQPM